MGKLTGTRLIVKLRFSAPVAEDDDSVVNLRIQVSSGDSLGRCLIVEDDAVEGEAEEEADVG